MKLIESIIKLLSTFFSKLKNDDNITTTEQSSEDCSVNQDDNLTDVEVSNDITEVIVEETKTQEIDNKTYDMKYFTIDELCNSKIAIRKGIDNTPTESVKKCLTDLCEKILDPLREAYGKPIIVDSGYRCAELNKVVGGAETSQHKLGQAVDIRTVSDTLEDNMVLFELIKKLNLPYDQLIFEYGDRKKGPNWVHVSYSSRNRHQIVYIGC